MESMKKQRRSMRFSDKLKILNMIEVDKYSVSTVARLFKRNTSTICGIVNSKEKIRAKLRKSSNQLPISLDIKKKAFVDAKCKSLLKHRLCVMCLSGDRCLYPLKDFKKIFNICKPLFACVQLDLCKDHICWECKAHLAKITFFKTKVLKAQEVLSLLNNNEQKEITIEQLTTLSQTDVCLVSTDLKEPFIQPLSKINEIPIKHEDIKVEINDKGDSNINSVDISVEFVKKENDIHDENYDIGDDIVIADLIHGRTEEICVDVLKETSDENEEDPKLTDVCNVKRLNEQEMMKYREDKKNRMNFRTAKYACATCILVFDSETKYDLHAIQHTEAHGDFLCPICHLRFSNQEVLEKHRADHYNLYECRVCCFKCCGASDFKRHCTRNHRQGQCAQCGITFRTISESRRHRAKIHRNKPTCKVCFKELSTNSSLRLHMQLHEGMPMLECEICHKKMRGKMGLAAHRRSHVEPTEESFCVECGIQYKNKYLYRAHLRSNLKHVTSKDLRHKCPECGKGFSLPQLLKNHINIKHTKKYQFFCQECNKGYFSKPPLRKHIQTVHQGKEQPRDKLCGVCGKAFKTKGVLQQHMNTHSGERPYSCSSCSATFAFSGALHTHTRLVHKKLKRPVKAKV